MARVTWDGRALEIEAGGNLLTGALEAGILVPHLCFHPALTTPASCRLCAIEVLDDGAEDWRLTTACDVGVVEGMKVRTESSAVRQARAAAIEFQLLRHPLDCPSCDKSGECELQEFSFAYGGDGPYVLPDKGFSEVVDLGGHVAIDRGKCIQCTRCVRFCEEVTGTEELSMFDRGERLEVSTFPGARLDNQLSGNTVDLCPAGALIDKQFRLQPAWQLRGTDSICNGCSAGCNIRIDVNLNQVRRLKPRVNMAVNEYWMCDDGRHGWQYIHSPERLRHPLVRVDRTPSTAGDGHSTQPVASWPSAFNVIHAAFNQCRSQGKQIGVILGGQMTNEEAYLLIRLAHAWDSKWTTLRESVSIQGDISYKSGFTIRRDKAANRRGIEQVAAGLGKQLCGMDELIEALHQDQVGAAFVVGGGPGVRPGDTELSALEKISDSVVVLDIMQDELSALAGVVLPGCSFAEKTGTLTNVDGRTQHFSTAIEPTPGCLDDLEILKRLAARFGTAEAGLGTAEAIFADMAARLDGCSELAGLTYGKLPDASACLGSAQAYGGGWSSVLQRQGFLPVEDHNKKLRKPDHRALESD